LGGRSTGASPEAASQPFDGAVNEHDSEPCQGERDRERKYDHLNLIVIGNAAHDLVDRHVDQKQGVGKLAEPAVE
jgi:hypothetical protein